LIAAYCNDLEKRIAYVTSVSVIKEHMGKGVASNLMHQCIKHMNDLGMSQISLEVASDNPSAIRLYEKCGFISSNVSATFITMSLYLETGEKYEH
jgi:ribosomal protein S18 acetylase RimI-like enzyme